MAIRCIDCGVVNPEGARFCQRCGRSLSLDDWNTPEQNAMRHMTSLDSSQNVTVSGSNLSLGVVLILTATIVMVLDLLMYGDLTHEYPIAGPILYSVGLNALIMAFAGLGAIVIWSRSERTRRAQAGEAGEIQTGKSFFHTMEPSVLPDTATGTRFRTQDQAADASPAAIILLYLLAFFSPGLGCLLGVALIGNSRQGYRTAGRSSAKIAAATLSGITAFAVFVYLVALHGQ